MGRSVSSPDETLRRELKNTTRSGVFLTNFEMFHPLMKHYVECLTLLLTQNYLTRKKKKSSYSSDFQTLIKLQFPFYFLYELLMSLRMQVLPQLIIINSVLVTVRLNLFALWLEINIFQFPIVLCFKLRYGRCRKGNVSLVLLHLRRASIQTVCRSFRAKFIIASRCKLAAPIDLFTNTAAILNLLDLRSIMGCPGVTRSVFTRACIFLGKKAIIITFEQGTTIFFSHYNFFLGKLKEKQARNACMQLLRSCLHLYVNTVLFSVYSYFRKGCRKAYAPIPIGILGVYAWVLIERQPFLNQLYTAISSKVVVAQVYTPRPQRSM